MMSRTSVLPWNREIPSRARRTQRELLSVNGHQGAILKHAGTVFRWWGAAKERLRLASWGFLVGCFGLLLGCGQDNSAPAPNDCSQQVRLDEEVYNAGVITKQSPQGDITRVEVSDCADVGRDPAGAYFPDDATVISAQIYGEDDEVLGVPLDEGTWQVYLAESISPAERRQFLSTLKLVSGKSGSRS